LEDTAKLMPVVSGFPRPDWNAISKNIELLPEERHSDEWLDAARSWLATTLEHLPSEYRIIESANFLLLSAQDARYVELLSSFLERSLTTIVANLDQIALDEGNGKHVVLVFDNHDTYYQYMSYFYPEDSESILSSGVFLNTEYGHFTFPFLEMSEAEATAAHELTHACLRHLPIPLWLNEGFAVTMEDDICGSQPLQMEQERLEEHRNFWNAETIQEFWSGYSFNRTDEGSNLSYELARYCLRALAHDYDAFARFANLANYDDGGEAAAIEVFEGSLGGLIYQFFGDGDWSPNPATWQAHGSS
jgi:hypothetical protein